MLAQKAAAAVNKRINGSISIGSVHVSPFEGISLSDLAIIDGKAFHGTGSSPEDTLLKAEHVSAIFSLKSLLGNGRIGIRDIRVTDGFFVFVSEPSRDSAGARTTNIARIFSTGQKKAADSTKKIPALPVLEISSFEAEKLAFRMKNYDNAGILTSGKRSDAINWKDLDVSDINLKAGKVRIKDGTVSANVESLSFVEKSGLAMERLAGRVKVGGGKTDIKELLIKDSFSEIRMDRFTMSYSGIAAFSDFIESVKMDADIDKSIVDFKTISFFAAALKKMSFRAEIDGVFSGYVCDFSVSRLNFSNAGDGMHGVIDGRLTGLPDSQGMILNVRLAETEFTMEELGNLIRGFAPSVKFDLAGFAPGRIFSIDAAAKGPLNRLAAKLSATSEIGGFDTEISLRNTIDSSRPIHISGTLASHSLDLGEILASGELGPCSMMTNMSAVLSGGSPEIIVDTLAIGRLKAHGYEYKEIHGAGSYSGKGFSVNLTGNDPNLTFVCDAERMKPDESGDGSLRFALNLSKADLKKLNLGFSDEGRAGLSLDAEAYMNERASGNSIGEVQLRNIILTDEHGLHKAGDLISAIKLGNRDNSVSLNSSFLEGMFYGTGSPVDFVNDFSEIALKRHLPAVFGEPSGKSTGGSYELDLNLFDSMDVLSFLVPGLYAADSTVLKMSIDEDGIMEAGISSGRLAYKNRYLKDVNIGIHNRDSLLDCSITASELSAAPIVTKGNVMDVKAGGNKIGTAISYDNESELTNRGEIMFTCGFARNASGDLSISADFIPTELYMDSVPWKINPARIEFDGKRLSVAGFAVESGNHSIRIDGGYSSVLPDSLHLKLKNFDISAANHHLGEQFDLAGFASGEVSVHSPLKDGGGLLMNLKVDSTSISGYKAGTLLIGSVWNHARKCFDVSMRNSLDGTNNLSVDGSFVPTSKTMEGDVRLNSFELGYAEGLLEGIFSGFNGKLSGNIKVSGPLDRPDLQSDRLRIDDALMKVDFTNVAYNVSGPLHMDGSGVWFDDMKISDRDGNGGKISGGIGWNKMQDISFGTEIAFSEMLVIDMDESPDAAFYGKAYASGRLGISGPLSALALDINAMTARRGEFHIPISSVSSAGSSDLLVFKARNEKKKIDSYEMLMSRYAAPKKGSDVAINLNLNVTPTTEAFIELDKANGNVLSGRGSGDIAIEVQPRSGVFSLRGSYTLTEGNYHLDVMSLAKKDFQIKEGSSIKFGGDIMDSDLDIDAVYNTKASLGALIGDNSSTSRRAVECGISISDKLRSPKIGLSIEIPNLNPSTKAMVDNALGTEDKLQKQFLSLLVSGSFLPDDKSGIVNNSNTLNTTVAEIMASQLNNILKRLDIPVDLGLDLQSTNSGKSVYDLAISTALFNNRVTVNGTIGNSEYGSSDTGGEDFVGDLDIEVKVDQAGAFRVNFFSHSADQYSNFLDNSQRNGVGVAYQRDFDSIKEFVKSLFSSRKKRKEREEEQLESLVNAEKTVIKVEE